MYKIKSDEKSLKGAKRVEFNHDLRKIEVDDHIQWDLFPYKITDREPFLYRDHPKQLNPRSTSFKRYWKQFGKKSVEGIWVNDSGTWVYMMPKLFYYINYMKIMGSEEGDEENRKEISPDLSSVEWILATYTLCFDGFSGFELDKEFTCNYLVYRLSKGEELNKFELKKLGPNCYKENGELKVWVHPWEYLTRFYLIDRPQDEPLGQPLYENSRKNGMFMGSRGVAKDLTEGTLVYKEDGPEIIDNISIGDKIYDHEGKLTTVEEKLCFKDRVQYEIEFTDGRKVSCGEDHRWNVIKSGQKEYKTLTLKEILKDYDKGYKRKTGSKKSKVGKRDIVYRIQQPKPIKYKHKKNLFDPYFLGLWLGDGSKHRVGITTADKELVEYCYRVAEKYKLTVNVNYNKNKTCPTYFISSGIVGKNKPLREIFKSYNLFNNKHIPEQYLLGSEKQRMSLLQGLMDSDGTVDKKGSISFSQKCDILSGQVVSLCRSLGIKTRVYKKTSYFKGVAYPFNKIILITGKPVFRLKRKLDRVKIDEQVSAQTLSKRYKVGIKNIVEVGVKKSYCIKVDNKDSLFICGDYIVTHNSYWAIGGDFSHEWTYGGIKEYENLKEANTRLLFAMGSGVADPLSRSLKIISGFYDNQPGQFRYPDPKKPKYMGPFYKRVQGSWKTGGQIDHLVKTKQNKDVISGSSMQASIITPDRKRICAGDRFRRVYVEEVGFLCMEKGTKIRMFDLSLKNIEDIEIGDKVLRPDGHYNTVEKLANGVSELYKVEQKRGIDYFVTPNHLLYVESRPRVNNRPDEIKLIKAEDFNPKTLGKYNHRTTYGKKTGCLEFKHTYKSGLNPYFLGLWIGDGLKKNPSIVCEKGSEIQKFIEKYTESLNMKNTFYESDNCDKIHTVRIKKKKGKTNYILQQLKKYKIFNKKRIPVEFQKCSVEDRLQLLAGIIDTDGNISTNNTSGKQHYEIGVSDRESLVDEICLLARNLGFNVGVTKKWTNKAYGSKKCRWRWKYRIRISGNIWRMPVKTCRKKAKLKKDYNVNNSTPINVSYSHVGEYYGFELSGDKLYVLEDNTITHNTYITEVHSANKDSLEVGKTKVGSAVYMGTSGDLKAIKGVKKLFENPSAYSIFGIPNYWKNPENEIGLFLPAYYKFRGYKDEGGNNDLEEALKILIKERVLNSEQMDSSSFDDYIMYAPITPDEMLRPNRRSFLPVREAQERLSDIEAYDYWAFNANIGDLVWDPSQKYGVDFRKDMVNKMHPIKDYNIDRDKIDIAGAYVLFEPPMENIPENLYTIIYDPVSKPGKGESLDASLNVAFVYKGFYKGNEDTLEDSIVAEWVGREDDLYANYERVVKLAKYYNARIFPETNTAGFVTWCRENDYGHLLQQEAYLAEREINPNYRKRGSVGFNIYGPRKKPWLLQKLKSWLLRKRGLDKEGNYTSLNIQHVLSTRFLEEIVNFNETGNFDYVSAALGLMLHIAQSDMEGVELIDPDKEEEEMRYKPTNRYVRRRSSFESY